MTGISILMGMFGYKTKISVMNKLSLKGGPSDLETKILQEY